MVGTPFFTLFRQLKFNCSLFVIANLTVYINLIDVWKLHDEPEKSNGDEVSVMKN